MPTADVALSRLTAGNARFVSDQTLAEGRDQSRRAELVGGQQPWAIVLSCADSRVAPEIAFDTGLGELFVIRVAGNVANTSSIASIEYAVAHIGTPLIVVLGHQSCGAVGAAIAGGDNGHNLNHLLAHLEPARAANEGAAVDVVVRDNAARQIGELSARSAIIRDAVAGKGLQIVSAFYSLADGSVTFASGGNS
ncbi:MAG: carbonic anhydrase [Proteobacteria bacterium]|nr:carbonic anhydrase [Pseudomonadota bacterium]